ncbi:MAG: quinolinate synthase NadA [Chloroflexota bacterium]
MESTPCVGDAAARNGPSKIELVTCLDPGLALTFPKTRRHVHPQQALLPQDYLEMSAVELDARLASARKRLGQSVVVLGHHYQRDEIVRFADFQGDSFKLSQQAARCRQARFIVFCGVHFMAESADILSLPEQQVILPNLEAGCSMAEMAHLDDVRACWEAVTETCDPDTLPIAYINSAATLKAFCGARGGVVCTSSNAPAVLRWALERSKRVLFFPDEHLARNTARDLGLDPSAISLWDPAEPLGGNDVAGLRRSRLIPWKGYCSVHMRFSTAQIAAARASHPQIKVIVHPECRSEVVLAADLAGSTEFIVKTIAEAPAGSQWAVGTEVTLVGRLARKYPDKQVLCLDPVVCPCSTMYRIHPAYLLWVLERLVAGEVVNRVTVPEAVATWARVALNRMLALA